MDALMFLLKLAYASRFRLPLLLTVGFMVLDVRMQLEINIHSRSVQRQRRPAAPIPQEVALPEDDGERTPHSPGSDVSNDSWMTLDEMEVDEAEGSEHQLSESPVNYLSGPISIPMVNFEE